MTVSLLSSGSKSRPWLRWLIVVVLTASIAAFALPRYLSGQWPWQVPPGVAQIQTIRALKDTGLAIEAWSEDVQQKINIGRTQWSVQQLTHATEAGPQQMVLFLKPQGRAKDQPEVEWIDLKGAQKWQTSDHRRLRMNALTIDTFRAWTATQTFAVAQWYSLPQGGHPAPHHWFWRDQKYQWVHRERLPWVAVSLLLPMPPLEDISLVHSDLKRLSQIVQVTMDETVFRSQS